MAYPFMRLNTEELERYFRKMIREDPSRRFTCYKILNLDLSNLRKKSRIEMLKSSKICKRPN